MTKEKSALMVVDVQKGLFEFDFPVYKGEELINNIKILIEKARKANVPIIYIQHTQGEGGPLAKDSDGWKIHPEIEPKEEDILIAKTTPDSFNKTELHDELTKRNIQKLVIVGLQTEYCIDTTCRRAFSLGYETILPGDGHSTYGSRVINAQQMIDHHNMILGGWFAKVMKSEEVSFTE